LTSSCGIDGVRGLGMADKLTSRRASNAVPRLGMTTIYQEIAVAVAVAICAFMAFKLFVFVFKIIGLL
jgi:hypothetical protein